MLYCFFMIDIDERSNMADKRQRKKQEQHRNGGYRSKSIVVNFLLVIGMFVKVPEEGSLHTKCKQRIGHRHVAVHGSNDTVSAHGIGARVDGRHEKGKHPAGNSAYAVNSRLAREFFSC